MVAETWTLIALIVAGAFLIVVHCILIWTAMRSDELDWRWRVAALVPVLTPGIAWKAGFRVWPLVWGTLVTGYVVLRLVSGA